MEERIEPEILREMRIVEIQIPHDSEFEPKFTEAEAKKFNDRDTEVLKAIKTLELISKWNMRAIVQQNEQLRRMEAEQIRQGKVQSSLKSINKIAQVGKGLLILGAGGVATKLGEVILVRFFP